MLPSHVEGIAKRWRDRLFTEREWQRSDTDSANPGEAGGFFVEAEGFPLLGYLKPTKPCSTDHPRAAYEKIAADLAYEIEVTTPPVLLHRREDCPANEEPCACISLVVYEEYHEWHNVWGLDGVAAELARTMLARGSGVVALDTWIDNRDRHNRRNGIFGVSQRSPAESAFMYLDHANAFNMGDNWNGENWETVNLPDMPNVLENAVDTDRLESAITAIENVSDDTIDEIVGRIPEDYMNEDHKEVVRDGLKQRRGLIRDSLDAAFGL